MFPFNCIVLKIFFEIVSLPIIREIGTPLGTRYVARRADVRVVAKDDSNSAISGVSYDFVITMSSAPVSAGQYVRLANS